MTGMNLTKKRPMTVFAAVGLSLCMLFCALPQAGCTHMGAYTTSYFDTFDTVLTVTVGAPSRETAAQWSADLHGIAKALHAELSSFDHTEGVHGIHALNEDAGSGTPLPVSEDVINVLLLGEELYRKTEGRLNICLGALTSLWRRAGESGILPDEAALQSARASCDMTALALDPTNRTACLTDPAVSLDVGAVAKGYALEKMRLYAEEQGITALLVNFGGQVMAIGRHPDGSPWTVAIRDPRDGSVLETLEVENAIVATSADDQRTFTVDGIAYHHIIDPATGYPAILFRSVTVLLPLEHTAVSDGLSTALFLLPRDAGQALLKEYGGSALRMESDGSVAYENWKKG